MKRPLSFFDSGQEFLLQDLYRRVIRQLDVIRARHNRDQKVIRLVRRLAWLTYYGEHGIEAFESWQTCVNDYKQGKHLGT